MLRKELMNVINEEQDFVIIYKLSEGAKLERDILTQTPDPTNNFL